MKVLVLLACVLVHLCFRGETWGTQVGGRALTVEFGMERPVPNVKYHFLLREDGTGTYTASYPATPPATPGGTVSVPLMLHRETTKKILEQAASTVALHGNCETRAKNIAQTGTKSLTFTNLEGASTSCAWNYSEKPAVRALQDEFIAMAATLDAGRKLALEQRFDRLGMDRDTAFLLEQAQAGQAQGLENIVPTLQAILDDTSLLERVRSRARALLELSKVER